MRLYLVNSFFIGGGPRGDTPGYCVFYRLSSVVQECKVHWMYNPSLINDLDIATLMDPLASTTIHAPGYTDCTIIQN